MKKFLCRLCHRSYTRSSHLARHKRSKLHLSMKCSVFRPTVPFESELLSENKIAGDLSSMPKHFTCPCRCVDDPNKQCPKVYECLSSLRKHTVLIHGAHYSHVNGNGSVTYLKDMELLTKQAACKKPKKGNQSQLTISQFSRFSEGTYRSSAVNQLSGESVEKLFSEGYGSNFQSSGGVIKHTSGPIGSLDGVSIKCEPHIVGEQHQGPFQIAENCLSERSEHQADDNTSKLHLQKRSRKFLHRCTNCQRSFAVAADFQQHLLMYFVESSGGQFRWLCHPKAQPLKNGYVKQGEKFRQGSGKFSLGKHASSFSTTVDTCSKERHCNICGKTYSSIKSLNSHKRRHYRVGMQAFQCKCGLSFLGSRQLTDHMATHFTTGIQSFDADETVEHVEAGKMNGESNVTTGKVSVMKNSCQLVKQYDSTDGIASTATTQQSSSICEANPEKRNRSTADVLSSNSNIIASVIQLLHAANRLTDSGVIEEELTKWLPNAPRDEIAGYITCVCTTVQCMRRQLHASNQLIAVVPSSNTNIIASVIQLLHAANRLTDKAVIEQELTKWLPSANCDEIFGYITCICTTVQCLSRQQYAASCNLMTSTVNDSLPKVSHVTSINDDSCLHSKCNDDNTATNHHKVLPSSSVAKNHVSSSAVKTSTVGPPRKKTISGSGLRSCPKSRRAVKPPALRNCYVRLRRVPTITHTLVKVEGEEAVLSNSLLLTSQDEAAVQCTETQNVETTKQPQLTKPATRATTSAIPNNDVSKRPRMFSADIFGNVMLRLCARGGAMNDAVILNELKQWLPSTVTSDELDAYMTYIRATAQCLLQSENINTPGKSDNCLVDSSLKSDGPGSDNDGRLVSLDDLGDGGNEVCDNGTNIDNDDICRAPVTTDLLNSSCERNRNVDRPSSEPMQCKERGEIVENNGSSSKCLASTVPRQRFPCFLCGNTFSLRHSVVRHIGRRHPAEKSLACRVCGGAIGQCWCCKQQQDVAQEEVEQPLEDGGGDVVGGDESTGPSKSRFRIIRIIQTNIGESNPCFYCKKTFSKASNLRKHEKRQHAFHCQKCGLSFMGPLHLQLHSVVSHCDDEWTASVDENECREQPLENSSVEPPNCRVVNEMQDQHMENSPSTISQRQIDAARETVMAEWETSAEVHQLNQS